MPSRADIVAVLREVWCTMLNQDLHEVMEEPMREEKSIAGTVQITGAWEGAVMLQCTERTARVFTAELLGIADHEVNTADLDDAVGELANVVGGNIKSLLPGPSALSLPMVTRGLDYTNAFPHTRVVQRILGRSADEPFCVTLLARADSGDLK